MEGIEFKAHKVEQAIENGLKELQLTKEEVDIEIISNGGLFSKATVRITPKVKPEQAATDFVNNLFSYMKFESYAELTKTETDSRIDITGADSPLLIGYRGDILDSLQYLALLIANKNTTDFVRVSVNTENYREKRKEILTRLAGKLAIKAERTGRKIDLEPMNPYERRVIHSALQDSATVTTESVGEEPNRYVLIVPKNPKPQYANNSRPVNNGRPPYGGANNGGRRFDNNGRPPYGGRNDRAGYNGNRSGGGYESRNGDGNNRGYENRSGGYDNRNGGYDNRNGDGNNRGYGNRSGGENNNRSYENRSGGYENRNSGGGSGGYAGNNNRSGGCNNRDSRPSYPRTPYTENSETIEKIEKPIDAELEVQESADKDNGANANFSNNFKKTGTSKMKSFGYKR
ncbi:MAG: KH domain-containing protein [Clostridiales bacterium]|jgi:spoIIIJ-associated protein|nr:KH domain-containing protein [Clostridiales bacterium]